MTQETKREGWEITIRLFAILLSAILLLVKCGGDISLHTH
jgi:hypothetical protein